jgi:hypothetical protein
MCAEADGLFRVDLRDEAEQGVDNCWCQVSSLIDHTQSFGNWPQGCHGQLRVLSCFRQWLNSQFDNSLFAPRISLRFKPEPKNPCYIVWVLRLKEQTFVWPSIGFF